MAPDQRSVRENTAPCASASPRNPCGQLFPSMLAQRRSRSGSRKRVSSSSVPRAPYRGESGFASSTASPAQMTRVQSFVRRNTLRVGIQGDHELLQPPELVLVAHARLWRQSVEGANRLARLQRISSWAEYRTGRQGHQEAGTRRARALPDRVGARLLDVPFRGRLAEKAVVAETGGRAAHAGYVLFLR